MAYKIRGVIRLDNSGNANLGVATATEFDGKVTDKAITEQTDGTSGDVTGADELLLYDTTTGDLLRVTVDEFITGAGIAPVGIVTSDTFVSVGASLIPDTNITYDLGSPTNRFRDIYLEGNTIYLGDTELSADTVVTSTDGYIDAAGFTATSGIITTTQIGPPGSGALNLDGDLLPIDNRTKDLGHATKSWRKVYVKSGPKAIEFEGTGVGFGLTVNAQLENIFEFDGHELFLGDGDIGHHGNLNSIYASGIVSATSFKVTSGPTWTSGTGTPEASVTAPVGSIYTRTDGGASTTLYVKESGTGNTGWVAK